MEKTAPWKKLPTLFLGHQVGGDVTTPSRDNLEKVRNTPRPTTKKQVRSFLGLVGYYGVHIPAFADISAPLTDLLKKGKADHIQWSKAQERAYSLLKEYLLQEPVLKLPDLDYIPARRYPIRCYPDRWVQIGVLIKDVVH